MIQRYHKRNFEFKRSNIGKWNIATWQPTIYVLKEIHSLGEPEHTESNRFVAQMNLNHEKS